MKPPELVSIRPQVTVLAVLKYLEYETWFALAEFVDNSIASYLSRKSELIETEGKDFCLEVKIEIDENQNSITIRDNAAGIEHSAYARAFRAAEIPPDTTGLSEFGMGMKSAACWFADEWSVRSTAIGEDKEKTVCFDMKRIFEDKLEELEVEVHSANKNHHYTIIKLNNVNKLPRRRGVGKVKEHLASIYRYFIRRGVLVLTVNNEILKYKEPNILCSTRYDDPKGNPILWKRDIDFPIDNNLKVHGFVAIREKASTQQAGFALFRRGRVIEGSYDNGFRPEFIFGNPNSFRYQRVFGELHLEGFDVSFTKKGIKWDDNLDIFLKLLRDDISHPEFPLLQQAEKHRVRASEKEYHATKKALDETVDDLEKKAPQALVEVSNSQQELPEETQLAKTTKTMHRDFQVKFNKSTWNISIELSFDPSLRELIEIGNHLIRTKTADASIREVGIRLSLTHPFMVEFVGIDNSKVEAVLRIAAALGMAEVLAKESGVRTQGEVRRNFNELITRLTNRTEHA